MKVIVTGGAGLIGSTVVWRLNQAGIDDILITIHESDILTLKIVG